MFTSDNDEKKAEAIEFWYKHKDAIPILLHHKALDLAEPVKGVIGRQDTNIKKFTTTTFPTDPPHMKDWDTNEESLDSIDEKTPNFLFSLGNVYIKTKDICDKIIKKIKDYNKQITSADIVELVYKSKSRRDFITTSTGEKLINTQNDPIITNMEGDNIKSKLNDGLKLNLSPDECYRDFKDFKGNYNPKYQRCEIDARIETKTGDFGFGDLPHLKHFNTVVAQEVFGIPVMFCQQVDSDDENDDKNKNLNKIIFYMCRELGLGLVKINEVYYYLDETKITVDFGTTITIKYDGTEFYSLKDITK